MRPRSWLLITISATLLTVGSVAGLNMMVDVYGLFKPSLGRPITGYGDDRVAKYLLSTRYVPDNFTAMLAGASVTANWDLSGIEHLHVYNASLNGANIVEERAVLEASLDRPGIAVVFLGVHPALTASHEFHTVVMNSSLRLSALGSVSLWDAYKDMLNIRLGRIPARFDAAGTETFQNERSEMNIVMKKMWDAPDFTVDPVALKEYLDLVANLRAHGVKIVFFVPPTSETLLQTKRPALERYAQRVHAEVGEGDLWLDLMAPEYSELCQPGNFSDGVHFTVGGAKKVVAQVNQSVDRWMSEQRLVVNH